MLSSRLRVIIDEPRTCHFRKGPICSPANLPFLRLDFTVSSPTLRSFAAIDNEYNLTGSMFGPPRFFLVTYLYRQLNTRTHRDLCVPMIPYNIIHVYAVKHYPVSA